MKKIIIFIIFYFLSLFLFSGILAQPIPFLPDDLELEQKVAKRRGETDDQLFDKTIVGFYQNEEYDKAIEYCKQILIDNPGDYFANGIIGTNYVKKGNFKKAVEYYQKSTNIYPMQLIFIEGETVPSPLPQDEVYWKKLQEVIEGYKKEIVKNPDDYRAYNELGYWCFILRGSPKLAMDCSLVEEYFKKSIAIKPNYTQAHYNLALYYLCYKDKKLALEQCRTLERLDKNLANVILRTIELSKKRPDKS